MAWVQSRTESFAARHSEHCTDDVARLLGSLETLRTALGTAFGEPVDDLTLVLHDGPHLMAAANPLLAARSRCTERSSRPLLTGWVNDDEIHLLSPPALRARGAGNRALSSVLAHAAASLYTRRVIMAANPDLRRAFTPAHGLVSLRWAWLLDGASRWFSGESAVARPLVSARLRTGPSPAFPPRARDAPLLAGTVIDLLVREQGEAAALAMVGRLDPGGAEGALVRAFAGRSMVHTEGAWRAHLSRLGASRE